MKKLHVGLQLYGLRDRLENSPEQFAIVMKEVKEIGYDGVELAGLYGLTPQYVKNTLDQFGLVPISAHVPLVEMLADIDKIIGIYSYIGCRFLVIPYLPEEYRHLTLGYETAILEITRIGTKVANRGMSLLYHNHDFEFVVLPDGNFGIDDIYSRISLYILMAEPDTCWIRIAGLDPVKFLKKYKYRCPVVHLKDYIKEGNPKNLYRLIGIESESSINETGFFEFRPVGFGQQIWEPILNASLEANAEWVIVEQDEPYDLTSIECARRSRAYLKILGW